MATLITGGGSKVGTYLGQLLKAAGHEVVFASRTRGRIPEGFETVNFDWDDPSTFEGALNAGPFETVYLVGKPASLNPAKEIVPLIELALQKGVKNFVYLSATQESELPEGGGLKQVPNYLKQNGINHVVLRPTWFIENLAGIWLFGALPKGEFETAVPTARIPFVATEDIAGVAFKAISEGTWNKDIVILGPELLTYDEYASIVSDVLGRTVTHKPVSAEESLQSKGAWAKWLVDFEVEIEEHGLEERWWNMSSEEQEKSGVEVFRGKTTVREWVEKNKDKLQ